MQDCDIFGRRFFFCCLFHFLPCMRYNFFVRHYKNRFCSLSAPNLTLQLIDDVMVSRPLHKIRHKRSLLPMDLYHSILDFVDVLDTLRGRYKTCCKIPDSAVCMGCILWHSKQKSTSIILVDRASRCTRHENLSRNTLMNILVEAVVKGHHLG